MTQSKPPITGTTHTLPFDKLSPREFERLCLWLVEREGYTEAEHLGAAGSEQGRDIVAWREGALWAFQCKRVRSFGPKDALLEVDKVLALPEDQRPVGLVFLVTCDVSANTRQQARARCAGEMECHWWAGTELDQRVKEHPDILAEFFQAAERTLIQRLLGLGPDERRAMRNRQAMLELVRSFWVEGVLEQSLHGAVMIELGLEERADAVERPWDMVLQAPDQPKRTLPSGTEIVDVFDEVNGTLLILGEPGSGKTTMLLELARETIARAEEDLTQPIPVVLNLSSWAEKRQPVSDWLVDELNIKYNIPRRIARPWVDNDDLLLLLDGLDEVNLEYREECVRAINDFRQEHGLTPLVVCSRIADYEALTTKLKLQGAVLLQPLTPQQVEEFLAGSGTELSAVRETLQRDATLQELAQTPLMLSVMILAYRGRAVEDLHTLDTTVARRKHVFQNYVQRMFERRGADQPYSPQQTIQWLAWLAQEMSEHAQTVFLIERLQPDWLPARVERQMRIGAGLVGGLGFGLVGGAVGGRLLGLVLGLVLGLEFGLVFQLVFGLVFGLLFGLLFGLDFIQPVEALKWSWREARRGLVLGLIGAPFFGLLFGLLGGLLFGLLFGLFFGLVGGLAFGLVGGLVIALGSGLRRAEIEVKMAPNQGIRRSAKNALIAGLVIGLVIALVSRLSIIGPFFGVVGMLLVFGLVGVLVIGLGSGLRRAEIEVKMAPNQGIRRSAKNALIAGLVIAQLILLVTGPVFWLPFALTSAWSLGGEAVILHLVLRYFLWRKNYLPWDLVRFLDYAAERIFLRKVGGGYIFIHRLLQDYFASLYQGE